MLRELLGGRQRIGYPQLLRHTDGMPTDDSGRPLKHIMCPGCGTVNHIDHEVYRIRGYLDCSKIDCGAVIPYSKYRQAYRRE